MSDHIVRYWKEPDARNAVGIPAHPAGVIELSTPDPAGGAALAIEPVTVDCTGGFVCCTLVLDCQV